MVVRVLDREGIEGCKQGYLDDGMSTLFVSLLLVVDRFFVSCGTLSEQSTPNSTTTTQKVSLALCMGNWLVNR